MLLDPELAFTAASFTRAGAGAGASAGEGAVAAVAAGLLFASVVLDVPPLVVGAVGVGAPVSTGAFVSASLAPLSERGTLSFAGGAPVPVVSIPRLPVLLFPGAEFESRVLFASRTRVTALVCGGSTIVGSPTLDADEVSG